MRFVSLGPTSRRLGPTFPRRTSRRPSTRLTVTQRELYEIEDLSCSIGAVNGGGGVLEWVAQTLRTHPEIAIFLALGIGYYVGKFTFRGIGLGAVTSTLLAAVLIGQLGITISGPLKATVFLMFLFAVGYGVGPQFVRGIAKDGVPQALFAAV